ncbi:MAG: FliM/FliN family flagellar motor C-terminal domain-containing protein [Candidatus Sulfotelmatobacter sp.]
MERPSGGTGGAPANPPSEGEEQFDGRWKPVLGLRCELTVDLPMPAFKIADLVKLRKGSVIDAHWCVDRDVPLRLNATLIGWIEFEVVADNLAVRLTELA